MPDTERTPIDYVDAGPIDANTYIIGIKTESPYSRKSKPADLGHLIGDALFLNKELKGAAGGIAELDSSGKVPSSQLPSYVDDVVEGYLYNNKFYEESTHATEIAPEAGKIYVDITDDKNLSYRWGGTAYSEISPSLALGETSATAYRGDRGKTAYDHSQLRSGNPHNVTASDLGLATVATSGSYSDLSDKPTIPAAQVNSDWNATTGVAKILNKPTIPTVPTKLSAFTDDLGSSPTHTHSQYLTSHQDISGKADKATTLAGYGITDAKIANGIITLGSNTIKPVTDISGKADKATTLAGYGITDAKIANGIITLGSSTITPITDVSDRVPTSRTVNGKALSSNISLTAADVGASASGHTHSTSIAASTGTNQLTLSASTKYAITAGGTSYVFTTPPNTTYSAGTALTLTGTQFSVSSANVSTMVNLLGEGTSPAQADDYLVAQYAGGGATNTTYYRRKVSNVVNSTVVKAALGTGSGTTKYLREDGTWVKPPNTTYESKAAASGGTDVSLVTTGEKYTWNNKTSNTGTVTSVTIKGSAPISVDAETAITTSGTRTISHANSGATAGSYGDSSNQTPAYGGTFKVPYVKVNATGHVTEISEHTVKIPASDNTDTKNTAGSTNSTLKLFLIGATSQAANPQTYSNSSVYATNGSMYATNYYIGGTSVYIAYNSTTGAIEFNN